MARDLHNEDGMFIGTIRENGDIIIGGTYSGNIDWDSGDIHDSDGYFVGNIS